MQSRKLRISCFVMVIHGEGILFGDKSAVFRGVQLEILAVLQTDAGLISHEIHKHFLFPDVLCPCAVQGDNRSGFLSGPAVRISAVTESSTS